MSIRILAVGKRHESWVAEGITRYERRLRKPFDMNWQLIPHSSRSDDAARAEESDRILGRISGTDRVVLLDERGANLESPELSRLLQRAFDASRPVVMIIGGAYGVDERVRTRADQIWSLSRLVFPHQLVRLIVAEQCYRAQEIAAGRGYHHA